MCKTAFLCVAVLGVAVLGPVLHPPNRSLSKARAHTSFPTAHQSSTVREWRRQCEQARAQIRATQRWMPESRSSEVHLGEGDAEEGVGVVGLKAITPMRHAPNTIQAKSEVSAQMWMLRITCC
jgi:hypothetical protein